MNQIIGVSVPRCDGVDKALGRAKFTADLCPADALTAVVLHSTVANGWVTAIHTEEAAQVPGVVKIVTCFDVPEHYFPTAGHPWSVEPVHQDVADRLLLNRRVRLVGDDVAAVVAVDEVAARRALRLIRVEYQQEPAAADWRAGLEAPALHPEAAATNTVGHDLTEFGDIAAVAAQSDLLHWSQEYATCGVSHCHIETVTSFAYMEAGRLVVVSGTQIPHVMRRIIGQALGLPWGDIRVIKPYLGGGFGNRQDVLYEPLNAFLCQQVGGRCVRLELRREEIFACTRRRHPIHYQLQSWVDAQGRIQGRDVRMVAEQGGYASHAQAVTANAAGNFQEIYYDAQALRCDSSTVYCNTTTGGAMRGYGIPQTCFAVECMMDDVAARLGMDPIQLRQVNLPTDFFINDYLGIRNPVGPLQECIRTGKQALDWEKKRAAWANQTGPLRHGLGMALFIYKSGISGKNPISLETASCRMVLNQDGSLQVQLGATEIGQGADTVFAQMAAEAVGVDFNRVHMVSSQDTDVTPFDTGAYASRQSFVSGKAVRKAGEELRRRILDYAGSFLCRPAAELTLTAGWLYAGGEKLLSLAELAENAFYSLTDSRHLTAEVTSHCRENAFSMGCCFAEVEVDMPLGRVKVTRLLNVHDCGQVLNPALAEAQVHGGQAQGLGMALSERMIYDKQGRLLNGTLLDYKLPTALDVPELEAAFAQSYDELGPFGNKSLGEPPLVPVSPAIRNAVFHATGVAVNQLPLHPEELVRQFKAAGLI